jgi:hypothetical protein
MSLTSRRIAYAAVIILAAMAIGRAAQLRFQEKERVIRQTCPAQLQKLGITRSAAKAKYPTPEIHMVSSGCLLPGGTGEVVVKGKFPPGTKFVVENDNVEVVQESLVGNEYRATVRIAPGVGSQTADIIAISPATCITARQSNAVVIGGRFEWNVESANGWKIVARSPANKACDGKAGDDVYSMEFFRKGESAPFEKRQARHDYSVFEGIDRFSIEQSASVGGMADYWALMQKMGDPKLSSAQREQLMKQIEKAQVQMQAEMKKMADPAHLKGIADQNKKFGCERIELRGQTGRYAGEMRCAEGVGTRIALTGTLNVLER